MGMGGCLGLMVRCMMDSMWEVRKMGKALSSGPTVAASQAPGKPESSMELVSTMGRKGNSVPVNGIMVTASGGSKTRRKELLEKSDNHALLPHTSGISEDHECAAEAN